MLVVISLLLNQEKADKFNKPINCVNTQTIENQTIKFGSE